MATLLGAIGEDLHQRLRSARSDGPVAIDDDTGVFVVLDHGLVESLVHDPRLSGVGLTMFDLAGVPEGPLREWYAGLMFSNEGDPHQRLRSLVSRAFTPRRTEEQRASTAEVVADALAPILAEGGGDLIEAFGLVPMRVMCRLLGVPLEDVEVFVAWTEALSPVFGFLDEDMMRAADEAVVNLLAYVDALVERRRTDPGSDLITALIAVEAEGDRLSHAELVRMISNLLVAGYDTTASQTGCTLLTLLRQPEACAAVRADGDMVGAVVSESMRHEPSVVGIPRLVVEPMRVAGHDLPAGTVMILSTAAANRDPAVWPDPETFVLDRFTRSDVARLVSFGAGPHYCVGAAFARMTLEEIVRAISHAPAMKYDGDLDAVEWRQLLGQSPSALPVTL